MGDSLDMFGDEPEREGEDALETKPTAAELEEAGQGSMFDASPPAASPSDEPEAAPEIAPETVAAPVAAPEPAQPIPPQPASLAAPSASPVQSSAQAGQPYRVLARKYRPQTFAELIGQEAMVRTLANAIERDRLAHAFLMTGVRGVGKTSTARLIAKALNCIGPDGQGGPTIDPCGQCEPCLAIAEGRHIDVIEMDAASHTGVDDVREIIEAVRYAAVSARYKIYIIDEVHMLSRNAFNALLKTLEEPPAHVKFLFATTEVDKLPVTVLSRCQRFDLRRIPTGMLQEHFAGICAKEGVEAEAEALHLIAGAAEGSVRDGLSILDQAIAHADLDSGGHVVAERVRDMLGLADKSVQRDLFAAILGGDAATLLDGMDRQYALGVEPLALMRSLMDLVHRITVAQIGRSGADAPTAEERAALEDWAEKLGAAQLHRLWQLLLKGHDEVRGAPDPQVAAQMALLRMLHAADLPDPGSLVKKLEELAAQGVAVQASSTPSGGEGDAPSAPPAAKLDWDALVHQVDIGGHLRIAQLMRDWVRVIDLAPGKLIFSLVPGLAVDPVSEMRDALYKSTGVKWTVEQGVGEGAPSLRELSDARKAEDEAALMRDPLVEAAMAAFPDAEIVKEDGDRQGETRQWTKRA
ncbi:DNA polymerase III subunit gamma/tau [Caenibius tardaugens NBRC 16725]|nr:DNA polymerase III subunit gamma/tau [Caenibius tardaugens]AZI38338.1 DNA polymerase III subunit gamma/tau [Caenibius tardaugens NBRC 16725]